MPEATGSGSCVSRPASINTPPSGSTSRRVFSASRPLGPTGTIRSAAATRSAFQQPETRQEGPMAGTVRGAVRELLEQTIATMEALLEASDRELRLPSSHPCAQGKDLWTLITNDIDHEKIHTGQVLEGRYESRITASPMQRLIAEWLAERARLVGSLVGLTDEQFNAETAPGQWTYRVIAKHVLALEQDSLKTLAADRAARAGGDGVPAPSD